MSDSKVQTVLAPSAINAEVASAIATLRPRGNSSSIASAFAARAIASRPASDVTTATWSAAVRAERGGQHVAKHRLGQRASLTGRQDGRQPGLGEFELLGCDQNKAHGVSL